MKIPTTISVMLGGVCVIETDVTAVIDYKIDRRHGELEWWVDEFRIEGKHRIWDKDGTSSSENYVSIVVPASLATVFDEHLNRDRIDEQVRERLADMESDRGDYLRDMAEDR
jgi:hypothetical protein